MGLETKNNIKAEVLDTVSKAADLPPPPKVPVPDNCLVPAKPDPLFATSPIWDSSFSTKGPHVASTKDDIQHYDLEIRKGRNGEIQVFSDGVKLPSSTRAYEGPNGYTNFIYMDKSGDFREVSVKVDGTSTASNFETVLARPNSLSPNKEAPEHLKCEIEYIKQRDTVTGKELSGKSITIDGYQLDVSINSDGRVIVSNDGNQLTSSKYVNSTAQYSHSAGDRASLFVELPNGSVHEITGVRNEFDRVVLKSTDISTDIQRPQLYGKKFSVGPTPVEIGESSTDIVPVAINGVTVAGNKSLSSSGEQRVDFKYNNKVYTITADSAQDTYSARINGRKVNIEPTE